MSQWPSGLGTGLQNLITWVRILPGLLILIKETWNIIKQ